MFEGWHFRRTFGFAPPVEWKAASEAQRRVVQIRFKHLENLIGILQDRVEQIEEGIRGLTMPAEILKAEACRLRVIKAKEAADHRLFEACRLAARYRFGTVAKYSWLVKHEQERREKAAAKLRDAMH